MIGKPCGAHTVARRFLTRTALFVVSQGMTSSGKLILGSILGSCAIAFTVSGCQYLVQLQQDEHVICLSFLLFCPQLPGRLRRRLRVLGPAHNPMQASSEFLEKVLVNNRTVAEKEPFLRSSWIAAVMVLLILLLVAAPRLRLDGEARARCAHDGGRYPACCSILFMVMFGRLADRRPQWQPNRMDLISLDESSWK